MIRGRAFAVGIMATILSGCGQQQATPMEQDSNSGKLTTGSTQQKTPGRLIFAFQRQKDPAALKEDAEAVGSLLSDRLKIPVDVVVPTSYGATVQALISNRAHVAYLSSLPFLLAEKEAGVEILLVEERSGKGIYDSVLVVRADDPIQNVEGLRGKRMAFTSPTSASGYVFPLSRFVEAGVLKKGEKPDQFFASTTFAGGYDRALLAVINGQADCAAVSDYTMEGPSVDKYLNASQRAKLKIIDRIPNVPTHLIAIRSDLPQDLKNQIKDTLLQLSKDQPERLKDVYGASTLVEPKGDHVSGTRKAIGLTGLDNASVVEK